MLLAEFAQPLQFADDRRLEAATAASPVEDQIVQHLRD